MVALLAATGCPSETCVELDAVCDPLYEPEWANVYVRTLQPSCGVGGGSCHSSEGAKGGLILDDEDAAFEGMQQRLIPGEASCSLIAVRLHLDEMPPSSPLSAAEQCAVQRWIDSGAVR
jgi:hypothetical protein